MSAKDKCPNCGTEPFMQTAYTYTCHVCHKTWRKPC